MTKSTSWQFRFLSIQFVVLLSCAACTYLLSVSAHTFFSLLLGGITAILPNAYLLFRGLGRQKQQAPKRWIYGFFLAECMKFLLAALLCFFSFVYWAAQPLPFFLGFVVPFVVFIFFFTRYRHSI